MVLHKRFDEEGYLWLKGILPRDTVVGFRRKVFEALAGTGLLAKDADPAEGIYSGQHGRPQASRLLGEIVRWASFEAFCLSEHILRFYEAFFGGRVYLHKRKILRYTVPGDPSCTGAHYDLTYLRAGTDTVCTSWIPIGDTPAEMGGVIYLEGSDAAGRLMEAAFAEKNAGLPPEERISAYNKNMSAEGWVTKDLPSLAERLNARWLIADYEAGDMVVHSAYMIHAATVNNDPHGRIRLSTDIRYQRVSDTIDARWGSHWSPDDGL
ncbi:MAG: phytanoyl-CoA dioxygenase family protein [Ignavibacteria bacterium]|nr:phytanoyl-CoA dioxygenase family protein [Ignavibacteria bacterium]